MKTIATATSFAAATRRSFLVSSTVALSALTTACRAQSNAGWVKYSGNPVLGGDLGTCFDVCLLPKSSGGYRMWFSWRPKKSIAWTDSADGVHWSAPQIALGPEATSSWENDVNRPVVLERPDGFHMWYTGQTQKNSALGYARSADGITWQRVSADPVLTPAVPWEGVAVMAPHVLWDAGQSRYRMWYSGGEQYEPNAIGYATSGDGVHWTRLPDNPVLRPDRQLGWEKERVTAAQVVPHGGWYYAFYIGFSDVNHAAIGIARSKDGVRGWQRHPGNPVLAPGLTGWDRSACYKPFALLGDGKWRLWYNGRNGHVEQIGMAEHAGEDLGFPSA